MNRSYKEQETTHLLFVIFRNILCINVNMWFNIMYYCEHSRAFAATLQLFWIMLCCYLYRFIHLYIKPDLISQEK